MKFTNDKCGVNTELAVIDTEATEGRVLVVLVDTNKIFIVYHTYYRKYIGDNSYTVSSSLSGVVCTINDTEITVGEEQSLHTSHGLLEARFKVSNINRY